MATGHERVPVLTSPDAAGDAAVDVADVVFGEQGCVHLVVGEPGVAAVDDHVAGGEEPGELLDHLAGGRAGGHHHPHRPRCGKGLDEGLEAADVADIGIRIVADDVVPLLTQTFAHVRSHPTEPYHTEFHRHRFTFAVDPSSTCSMCSAARRLVHLTGWGAATGHPAKCFRRSPLRH